MLYLPTNIYLYFVIALIPLAVGRAYFSDQLFGKHLVLDTDSSGKVMSVFGRYVGLYVFSLFIAFYIPTVLIHESPMFSLMLPESSYSGSSAQQAYNDIVEQYASNYRTAGHGTFHSIQTVLFFILPVLAMQSLFMNYKLKAALIHTGFWLISLTLMGIIVCMYWEYPLLN